MSKLKDALKGVHTAVAAVEAVAAEKVIILKAIKGNSRFKDSSVWVSLPSGNYKHVQSGLTTKASRLSGYTQQVSL